MALFAVERIDDAVDMTRSFLTPVDAGRWARLTVVVAFLLGGTGGGGGASAASGASNVPTTAGSIPQDGLPEIPADFPELSATAVAVILGAIALLIVIGLIVAAVGAVMEFVLVESLSSDEIHVRQYFRRHARKGLWLFAFRLLLGLAALAILGGTALVLFGDVAAALLAGRFVVPSSGRLLVGALVLVPLGIVVGVVVTLVNGFTTEFVVPIMLREDRGVLAGWRRFLPTLLAHWKQYGAYVLIAFVLHLVTGIAGSILVGLAAIVLAIPALIVAIPLGLGALAGGSVSVGAIAALAVLAAVYLCGLFLAAAVISVPITVFHRQFALLVLGDTNADFDVLGDRRPSLSA